MRAASKVALRREFSTGSSAMPTTELFSKLATGPMKRLYQYYTPEAVNIAGGVPMDSVFPMKSVSVTLADGREISCKLGNDLMMNYQRGDGTPGLRDWISKHVREVHNVPANSGSGTCMTIGSTDGLAKILQLITTDVVLLDEFAYGTAVAVCRTVGKQPVGVPMDEHGIVPERLEEAILTMRAQNLQVNLLYLVPTGQNPTGHSIAEERKTEVLRICQKMNVVIIEDGRWLLTALVLCCAVLCCVVLTLLLLLHPLLTRCRCLLLPALRRRSHNAWHQGVAALLLRARPADFTGGDWGARAVGPAHGLPVEVYRPRYAAGLDRRS
jgi:hypothetical protein